MQRIEIKHLGPVQESGTWISKILICLIGEQATGKSTVAKAIYFFRIIKIYVDRLFMPRYSILHYITGVMSASGFKRVLKTGIKIEFSFHCLDIAGIWINVCI